MPPGKDIRTCAGDIVDALVAHGVDYLFCNLGTDHAPLIEELARRLERGLPSPRTVLCPHENTAVHMAAGYAWQTGRAQAVLVHVDAGTANAAMGLHNLARTRLPLLLFAGRAPFSSRAGLAGERNSYVNFVQEPFDQASLVRPYVKWDYNIPDASLAGEAVARALERANSVPQGPVYLTAARETLAQEVAAATPEPYARASASAGGGSHEAVRELASRLIAAKSPLLLTAYAGRQSRNVELLETLATLCGIRVVEFTPHSVNLPHGSPCHGGFVPQPYVAQCDVGLLVDIDVPWVPALVQPAGDSWWGHIDSDVEKSGFPLWSFPGDLRMQGDSATILAQLIAEIRSREDDEFHARVRDRMDGLVQDRERRLAASRQAASPRGEHRRLNPSFVLAALSGMLQGDDVVLNEAVRNAGIVFEQMPRSQPLTRVGPSGGGLGYSAGMAMGIRLAKPGATVVSVVGDGVAYFGNPSSALAVGMRYKLPTLTVILDNGGWAAVKEATGKVYPTGHAARLGAWEADLGRQTDFALLAQAAGAFGATLEDPEQVKDVLAAALAQVRAGCPAVVHVHIAPFEETR